MGLKILLVTHTKTNRPTRTLVPNTNVSYHSLYISQNNWVAYMYYTSKKCLFLLKLWFCASHEWPSGVTISDSSALSETQEGGRLCSQRASASHRTPTSFHQVILLGTKTTGYENPCHKGFYTAAQVEYRSNALRFCHHATYCNVVLPI